MFGRCSSRGAVNRFILVLILEQHYFWWRIYPAFQHARGLLCLFTVSLFLALVELMDYGWLVI